MRYRAVIFDLFGTLVDSFSAREHEETLREMARAVGVAPDRFVELWNGNIADRAVGRIPTIAENVLHIAREAGIGPSEEAVQIAEGLRVAFARRGLVPRPDACPTVAALRERGLKTALISDCSPEVPALWRETSLAPLFDVAVLSSEVGLKKPDPRIYAYTIERLGVSPSHCLYVGDGGSQELTGARRAGLDAVQIAPPHALEYDAHILDADTWDGAVVTALGDLLDLV